MEARSLRGRNRGLRIGRMRPAPGPALTWIAWTVVASLAFGCRPDPYALLVRSIQPGEEVELPEGMTLVAQEREGTTLRGVRITGPARSCDGSMVLEAPEVRVEPPPQAGQGVRLVLDRPVARERCGESEWVTRHEHLILNLDAP